MTSDPAPVSSAPQPAAWTREAVAAVYRTPLLELVYRAAGVHRAHFAPEDVQRCTLLSIKTGNCPEDCAYCSQSAHHATHVQPEALMDVNAVLAAARAARAEGSTRFCMAAAWRSPRNDASFERLLEMVRGVRALGLEACCSVGMVSAEQARRLAGAGLTALNHNLDTSPEFYGQIVTTRTYAERLETLRHAAEAGIAQCCGGIVNMGESEADRIGLLHALTTLRPAPESVPINALVPVAGTPLADRPPLAPLDFVRMVATARILFPRARVRLSAGRLSLSPEAQALAFLAGANSIFAGERLLTTPNPQWATDEALLRALGLGDTAAEAAPPAARGPATP